MQQEGGKKMSLWSDAYTPAMQIEEAALLPARSRSIAGKSALMDAMRKADAILEKQVGDTVNAQETAQPAVNTGRYAFPGSRAALHQVWPGR